MSDDPRVFAEALAFIPTKYASPDPKILSKLPKPTNRNNEKGKCKECGGWHGLPAVHLDYMGHADVTLALLDVDPLWSWEPVAFDPLTGGPIIGQQGNRLVMWARLTILGKSMLGVGTCEAGKPDPEKELIGDFLRNAAMRFGIATNLWSKADSADPAGLGEGGGYGQRPGAAAKPPRQAAPPPPPADEKPVDPNAITPAQLKKLMATFNERGIVERGARLAAAVEFVGREIGSANDLTKTEAARLIDHLEKMPNG